MNSLVARLWIFLGDSNSTCPRAWFTQSVDLHNFHENVQSGLDVWKLRGGLLAGAERQLDISIGDNGSVRAPYLFLLLIGEKR